MAKLRSKGKATKSKSSVDDRVAIYPPQTFKNFTDAFNTDVEDDRDFISRIPSETLDNILSYLVLDHDPETILKAAAKDIKPHRHAHVLLSLAAMSRHMRDHVENFCRREILTHEETYRFKQTTERDKDCRRSARVQAKQQSDSTVYRIVLTRHSELHCISCNRRSARKLIIINSVSCCGLCEHTLFGGQIMLSDALRLFDLRDYMLLKSRKPGPRAKHTNLPTISYGTVYSPRGFGNGWGISYRFWRKDVEAIARIVHGDVAEHMRKKEFERGIRKRNKRWETKRQLKVRHHTDQLITAKTDANKEYHRLRLDYFEGSNWEGSYRSDHTDYSGFGCYDDIHERLCDSEWCDRCWNREYEKKFNKLYAKARADEAA